jgi:hypothetical protein
MQRLEINVSPASLVVSMAVPIPMPTPRLSFLHHPTHPIISGVATTIPTAVTRSTSMSMSIRLLIMIRMKAIAEAMSLHMTKSRIQARYSILKDRMRAIHSLKRTSLRHPRPPCIASTILSTPHPKSSHPHRLAKRPAPSTSAMVAQRTKARMTAIPHKL